MRPHYFGIRLEFLFNWGNSVLSGPMSTVLRRDARARPLSEKRGTKLMFMSMDVLRGTGHAMFSCVEGFYRRGETSWTGIGFQFSSFKLLKGRFVERNIKSRWLIWKCWTDPDCSVRWCEAIKSGQPYFFSTATVSGKIHVKPVKRWLPKFPCCLNWREMLFDRKIKREEKW